MHGYWHMQQKVDCTKPRVMPKSTVPKEPPVIHKFLRYVSIVASPITKEPIYQQLDLIDVTYFF